MKCGDWSACDLQFCKDYIAGAVCVYEGRKSAKKEKENEQHSLLRENGHDRGEYKGRVF